MCMAYLVDPVPCLGWTVEGEYSGTQLGKGLGALLFRLSFSLQVVSLDHPVQVSDCRRN